MLSIQPPRKPASAPIAPPMTMANVIAASPIESDVRAPCTTRLKTSRKLPSVPKMCCGLSAGQPRRWMHGPSRFSTPGSTPRSTWLGSCVEIWSANTAMNTSSPRMIRPTTAERWRRTFETVSRQRLDGFARTTAVSGTAGPDGASGCGAAGGIVALRSAMRSPGAHRSRTRGSRNPYEMSTTRLVTT